MGNSQLNEYRQFQPKANTRRSLMRPMHAGQCNEMASNHPKAKWPTRVFCELDLNYNSTPVITHTRRFVRFRMRRGFFSAQSLGIGNEHPAEFGCGSDAVRL